MSLDFLKFLIKEETAKVGDEKNELESSIEEGCDGIARLHKGVYDAYIRKGFNEEQALEMVKTLIINGG